jgi:hypothetical protein
MSSKTYLLKRIAQSALIALVGGFLATTPANAGAYEATVSGSCVYRNNPAGVGIGGFISVSFTKQNGGTGRVGVSEYTHENDVLSYGSGNTHTSLSGATLSSTGALDSNTSTIVVPIRDTMTYFAKSITYAVWLSPAGTIATNGTPGDEAAVAYVKCNVAGAPASYSLSATTATKNQGETATFTVTPKDAAGNTTILGFNNETITVSVSTTAGSASLQAGKLNGPTGASSLTSAGGASLGSYVNTETSTHTPTRRALAAGGFQILDTNTISQLTAARMPVLRGITSTTAAASREFALSSIHADALPTYQNDRLTSNESATATGAYTLNVRNTGAATTTVSITGTGASSAATFTLTSDTQVYGKYYGFGTKTAVTTRGFGIITGGAYATTGALLTAPTKAFPDGVTTSGASASSASTTFQVSTAKTSIPMTWQLSDSNVFTYTVAAVTGVPMPGGITAGTYTITPSGGETITSATFTTTAPSAGQQFKVTWAFDDGVTRTATFAYEAPQVGSSRGDVVLTNTEASKKIAVGGTGSAEATVTDQFGSYVSGATVIWSLTSGLRNVVAATTATTNASGKSSYSWTDADSTKSVTTYPTDTVKAEVTFGNSGTYDSASTSYTYVASLTAGSITVTNDVTDDVAADAAATFTVTVRDSSAAALSGYPVTVTGFSKSYNLGTGTVYTASATGSVTFTAYCKTAGDETLTFTSGGKSTTSTFTCAAGSSRTYSIDKTTLALTPDEDGTVTVTVVDRYGNVVEDQAVTVTYVGEGSVTNVNGVQASSGSTDANGKVAVKVRASKAGTGTLTIKATMGDASTAALRGDGTAMPAKTAATGFTTAVTISGSSATVSAVGAAQAAADAATDAALEAIDAANAATDAANLAAEAADAATVAAEEARDAADAATAAVEALATEVATLMAALKAQITTLASTVAKIAKKVKA